MRVRRSEEEEEERGGERERSLLCNHALYLLDALLSSSSPYPRDQRE